MSAEEGVQAEAGEPRPLKVGAEIARGGEGVVHLVPGEPGLVAKVWHEADAAKGVKISIMALHPAASRLDLVAAWPFFAVTGRREEVIGYAMRRVADHLGLHLLYTPKSRRQFFPHARWPFLVRTAANVARSFGAVHDEGFVIGDINHASVLVGRRATVTLVDCDSFQVVDDGRTFTCDVGVDAYTPPELQGASLSGVVRTRDHDGFGLAVLLFQLLFLGRHPFAGVFSGKGEMTMERAVAECRFAFSGDPEILPPPGSLALPDVGEALSDLFLRAFSRDAALRGGDRPSAQEWVEALGALERGLVACTEDPEHHHLAGRPCPFCRIELRTGMPTFGAIDSLPAVQMPDERPLVARLETLSPKIGDNLLRLSRAAAVQGDWRPPVPASARFKGRAVEAASRVANPLRWACLGLFLLLWELGAYAPSTWVWLLLGISFFVSARVPQWMARRLARPALSRAALASSALDERLKGHPGATRYAALLKRGREGRKALAALEEERTALLGGLAPNVANWLERHTLADATIEGLGESRLATLEAEGIENAGDVTKRALQEVPGIGPVIQGRILAWRKELEGAYRAQLASPLLRSKAVAVDTRIAARKTEVLAALERAVSAAEAVALKGIEADGDLIADLVPDVRRLIAAEEEAKAILSGYSPTAA